MSVGDSTSCSSCGAIAAGWKTMLEARRLNSVKDLVDIVDPQLGAAFDAMESLGRSVVNAGVEIAKLDAVGSLLDVTA